MGSGAMLKPTGPNLSRPKIRPGHWGQWLVTGAVGLVGFVVLALLLELGASIDQFDHRVLAAVISAREPNLTLLARAASLLGSAGARVGLAIAGAVLLWLRTRRFLLPVALLAAVAATVSLVTILKIALDTREPSTRRTTDRQGVSVGSCSRWFGGRHPYSFAARLDCYKAIRPAALGDHRMPTGAADRLEPQLSWRSLAD
jgi:hypothetical protein